MTLHVIKQDGYMVVVPKHLHTAGTVSDARNAKLLGFTSVTNLCEQKLHSKGIFCLGTCFVLNLITTTELCENSMTMHGLKYC